MRIFAGKVAEREVAGYGRPMALVELLKPAIGFALVPCMPELRKGDRVWVRPLGCPISSPWVLTPKLVHQRAVAL